ncbi:YraN family protein [bacterium]|nr:MAG: YraN family protein [bacterium]
MTQKSELGTEGENFAEEFLKRKGYKILGRNKREKWGELDIIAKAQDKTLVFVEVKTLRQAQGGPPEEQLMPEDEMTASKMKKFRRTAGLYAGSHQKLISDKKGWRLDLIALVKNNDGTFLVHHYENI